MMKTPVALFMLAVIITTVSGEVVEVPRSAAAVDDVRDEDLWNSFPELDGAKRLRFCDLGYVGGGCAITFEPRLTGPHSLLSHVVTCEPSGDTLACQLLSEQAWYDTDKASYFVLEAGLALADALPVVRAYLGRHLLSARGPSNPWPDATSWPGYSNPEMHLESVSLVDAEYHLKLSMCGCSAELTVRRRNARGGGNTFQVVREKALCI